MIPRFLVHGSASLRRSLAACWLLTRWSFVIFREEIWRKTDQDGPWSLKKTRWSDDPSDFQLVLEGCFVIPAVDEFKIAGRAWMCLLHSYFVAGLPSFLSLLQAWGETHHLQLGGCPRYSKSIIAIWKTHHESIMKVDHLERGTNRFTYIYIYI